tara:strand:- start:48 stop:734 length:687 start_codon:yes stop_codon:yes gene_type:complete
MTTANKQYIQMQGRIIRVIPSQISKNGRQMPTKVTFQDVNNPNHVIKEAPFFDMDLGSQMITGDTWSFSYYIEESIDKNGIAHKDPKVETYPNSGQPYPFKVQTTAPVAQPEVAQQPQAPAIDHLLQEFDLAPLPRINHHLLEDIQQRQRSIVRTSSLYIAKDLLIAHGKPLTVNDDDNTLDNLADMVIELTDKIEERFYKGNPVEDEDNDSTGHASRESAAQFYDQN